MIKVTGEPIAQLPQSVFYPANGKSVNDDQVHEVPDNVQHSVTLSVDPGSANAVEVSFDGGLTWPLVVNPGWIRGWDSNWRSGEHERLAINLLQFRGAGGLATFDLIGD